MIANLDALATQFEASPLHAASADGATAAPRDTWDQAIDTLLRIRSLEENWDGLGAAAPAGQLVDSAIRLVVWMQGKDFYPPDRITATGDGTVVFQWRSADGGRTKLDVEVTAPYQGELTLVKDGRVTVQQRL